MSVDVTSQSSVTETLSEGSYGGVVRRTILPGGMRILTESLPHASSATFGVYAPVGSRHEAPALAGASHFLEHLLFKGTSRRSAYEISAALEAVGGESNAYTTKEYTCFYARLLAEDLPIAIDVLCDMIASSVLDEKEMNLERGVVLEEISMHADEPEDVVHDLFAGAILGTHPLGLPILGSVESIGAMNRDDLFAFYQEHYSPGNLVIAAAGKLDHDEVVSRVVEAFAASSSFVHLGTNSAESGANGSNLSQDAGVPELASHVHVTQMKDIEQSHVILGHGGIDRFDKRRYSMSVLTQVLGGGMSSRLFQEVREKRGLAYSVYAFSSQFADTGFVGAYVGCAPNRLSEAVEVVSRELEKIAAHGITVEELRRGIGMVRGGVILGMEDTGSRMEHVGKGEILYGDYLSSEELVARVAAVTVDDVRALAAEVWTAPMSMAVIGPDASS